MFDFGFIGAGNMGSALCQGICRKIDANKVSVSDTNIEKAQALSEKCGCNSVSVNDIVRESRYIFLAVKPQMLSSAAEKIIPVLKERSDRYIIVSMLAGTEIEKIKNVFGRNCPVIRIMPNVACLIGQGMTLCAKSNEVTDEEYNEFFSAMEKTGRIDDIPEGLIDAASAVSGCGPAYAFMMIEALADGAVDCGVPRDKAYLYAAQMLSGSAQLLLESKKSPSELKDSVCSPAGTTIEGVRALEKGGFRSSVFEAVRAAYDRTCEIAKK